MDSYRQKLYDDIKASSNMVSGQEYRELTCAIAQVASDMVVKTLGPYGSTTMIDEGTGFTYPTKDGWSCLNKLTFTDPTYNTIYNMLKKISFNSVTSVGDGTTTAMVAANFFISALYDGFIKKLTADKKVFRQADFIEAMNKVYQDTENYLKTNKFVRQVDMDGDFSDIYRIAYIATNGNEEFSHTIQKIYQETKNPHIQVDMDPTGADTSYTIQKGYKFNTHVLNFPSYANDESGAIVYKDNPRRVVIFDHNVTFQMHEKIIGGLIGLSQRDDFELIIMAPYFDDIISSWMNSQVQKMVQAHQIPRMMLVQIPTTMNIHKNTLYDLTVLTNGQIFDEAKVRAFNILHHNQTHEKEEDKIDDPMFSLEQYSFGSPEEVLQRCLGHIRSIIFNKSEGFIQDYEGIVNKQMYEELIREARSDYESRKEKALKTLGGTLDKEYMFAQMRWIRLSGSTGVIKVGGLSDIQQRTDKDAIDDAVLACRSAFENGYVRGMNLEILSYLKKCLKIKEMSRDTEDYEFEILNMLYTCFYLTSLKVLENKHPALDRQRTIKIVDSEVDGDQIMSFATTDMRFSNQSVLDFLIENDKHYDYNLRTEVCHDPNAWEVVNSSATDVEILRAVINVLTTVITSNQFVSSTRRFDSKVLDSKSMERRLKDERLTEMNKVNAIVDAIVSNENYEILRDIFQPEFPQFSPTISNFESDSSKDVDQALRDSCDNLNTVF